MLDHRSDINLDPHDIAETYYHRGNAYVSVKDYVRAQADLDKAIEMQPRYTSAFNSRCWLKAIVGSDLAGALRDCEEALHNKPRDPFILDSNGFVLFRLGRFEEAIAMYDAALKRISKKASSLYIRGLSKEKLGNKVEAEADITVAKEIDPGIADMFAQYGVGP